MLKKLLLLVTVINNNAVWSQANTYENAIFPPLPVTVLKASNNSKCLEDGRIYVDSLRNFTLWAHQMYNSNAKTPSGLFIGNTNSLGHFEQCLTTKAPFPTQYCVATLVAIIPKPEVDRDPFSLNYDPYGDILTRLYKYPDVTQLSRNIINLAWCVPASCTATDLETYLNTYINEIKLPLNQYNVTYIARFLPGFCQSQENHETFDTADISICAIILFLFLAVLFSSIYDSKSTTSSGENEEQPIKSSLCHNLLISFSIKRSYADLTKKDTSHPALKILAGMRVIAVVYIVFSHRMISTVMTPITNFNFIEKHYRSLALGLTSRGDLFVDSFFLLSGLLLTYHVMLQADKKKGMNIGLAIFYRYMRLTPIYSFVILFCATLYRFIGSGPLWQMILSEVQDCRTNWWTNLLYLNNYINVKHMCLGHTWYLACDFHYFIIGTAFCILIKKNKKFGLISLFIATVISAIIPFVITVVYNGNAVLEMFPDSLAEGKTSNQIVLMYNRSHARATTYFIGMFAGYCYYKVKDSKGYLHRLESYSILFVSTLLIVVPMMSSSIFYNPYHKYNPIEAGAFASLNRPAFILGNFGILYVASYGKSRMLYNLLSWSPLLSLSKLVYGVYLTHILLQIRSVCSKMNPSEFIIFDMFSVMLSDTVLAFFVAFLMYVGIESPVKRIIMTILLPPKKVDVEQKATVENGNNKVCNSQL